MAEKYITFFKRRPYPNQKNKKMVVPAIHIAMALQEAESFGKYHAICGYSFSAYKCDYSRAKKAASKANLCKHCVKKLEKEK